MKLIITDDQVLQKIFRFLNTERETNKKRFLFAFIYLATIIYSFGQGQIALSGAYGFSKYEQPAQTIRGLGFNLSFRNAPRKLYSFGLSMGYQRLSWEDDLEEEKVKVDVAPLLAEFLFTPGDKTTRLILGLGVGVFYTGQTITSKGILTFFPNQLFTQTQNELNFGLCPTLGVRFNLSERVNLDFTLKRYIIYMKDGIAGVSAIHAGLTFYLQEPDED